MAECTEYRLLADQTISRMLQGRSVGAGTNPPLERYLNFRLDLTQAR